MATKSTVRILYCPNRHRHNSPLRQLQSTTLKNCLQVRRPKRPPIDIVIGVLEEALETSRDVYSHALIEASFTNRSQVTDKNLMNSIAT